MQQHQVTGHDLAAGDALFHASAHHQRARTGQIAQRLQRALGLAFLIDGDADHHEHGHQQDQRFVKIAERKVDRAPGDQQQQHRFAHDFQRNPQHVPTLAARQLVGSVLRQTAFRLGIGQPGRSELFESVRSINGCQE